MLQIGNPYPQFNDLQGALLDAGYIYVGVAHADPQVSPVQCYWDTSLTLPAPQPLRTRGGYIVNNGAPAAVYTAAADYSQRVLDADNDLVIYVPSVQAATGTAYQPLDSDLTALSGIVTQPYGRSLLSAATAVAARALLGLGNYLATSGGTMTGNIVRSGAGVHQYHTDGSFVSGRKFFTVSGAGDPTSQVGDEWWQYAP